MDVNPPKRRNLPGAAPLLVSACLLGVRCTFDGSDELRPGLPVALEGWTVVALCPEVAGGLEVPRPRCEIETGDGRAVLDGLARVRDASGHDHTDAYVQGARRALGAARRWGVTGAVLKARSPSCGCAGVYDGTHTGALAPGGVGVTAALFEREGIPVVSEDDLGIDGGQ